MIFLVLWVARIIVLLLACLGSLVCSEGLEQRLGRSTAREWLHIVVVLELWIIVVTS